MFTFTHTTQQHIDAVLADVRPENVNEAFRCGMDHVEALKGSSENSDQSVTALWDGEPVCIFGWHEVGNNEAIVWFTGSNIISKHAREFIIESTKVVEDLMQLYSALFNYVDNENTRGKRWLRVLGFTIGDPEPYGPKGALFCKFYRSR